MSHKAFALLCSNEGTVTEVIENCPFCPDEGASLLSIIDDGSREKMLDLICGLASNEDTVEAEIDLNMGGNTETFHLKGISTEKGLLFLAAMDGYRLGELCEFLDRSHPWLASIPGFPVKGMKEKVSQSSLYDEINRLNSELVDLQRELARKNAELERFYTEVRELSVTDDLTGVLNRRGFFERSRQEEERYLRYGRPLSAVMFDIDDFKRVNDDLGHSAGDAVLGRVARRLAAELRGVDILGRYGGDEFAILLPETKTDGAMVVATRLLKVVEEPIDVGKKDVTVTVSVGIACMDSVNDSLESLLKASDQALHRAKSDGGNRVSK
jgi:diguanylate cyclase (GGDEF)-like protein